MKIVFTANGRCASAVVEPAGQPITAGSRGVPAEIHLSPDYDGLVVTTFFRSEYGAWPVVLGETPGTVTIPWEAMEKKSLTFDVGVVGKNGDGTIVIPTIWARAGKIVPATEDSGLEPGDPSADIGAQIVEQARAAAEQAEAAAEAAEDARDKMPRIVDGTWWVYDAEAETWTDTGIRAEGQDGVGISGAVLNADYTLTLTFTDGSIYTTPPIRGPKGEDAPDDYILVQPTEPTSETNALWINSAAGERVQLPTMADHEALAEDVAANTEAIGDLSDELADQKSAIDDLTALTNRKAGMLVDSVSGAIASFVPDSTIPDLLGVSVDIEPVQDLHGYDAPWPAGGGVNKLSSDNMSRFTQKNYGVQYTVQADGGIAAAGTVTTTTWNFAQFYATLDDFGLSVGDTVALSCFGDNVNFAIHFYADNTMISGIDAAGTPVGVIPEGTNRLRMLVYCKASSAPTVGEVINKTFYPQLEKASTPSTVWHPYSNECPISGWDSVEVEADGANLFDINGETTLIYDNVAIQNNKIVISSIGSGATSRVYFAKTYKPGTYTFSAKMSGQLEQVGIFSPQSFAGGTYNAYYGGYFAALTNGYRTITMSEPFTIGVIGQGVTTGQGEIYDIQLEPGSAASDYHPYAGDRYTIQLGDTVYGGTLDVTAGTLTVDRVKYVIDGVSSKFNAMSDSGSYKFFSKTNFLTGGKNTTATNIPQTLWCNLFNPKAVGALGNTYIAGGYFRVCADPSFQTVDEFNAWIADNGGIEYVYELATPLAEITLDPVSISTIPGQTNNVWADAGDVDVTYAADLKAYIDSKIAALAAQIVNS